MENPKSKKIKLETSQGAVDGWYIYNDTDKLRSKNETIKKLQESNKTKQLKIKALEQTNQHLEMLSAFHDVQMESRTASANLREYKAEQEKIKAQYELRRARLICGIAAALAVINLASALINIFA